MSRAPLLALLALSLAAPAAGAQRRDAVDLVNVALAPEYANWLVGAQAQIASEAEIEEYLALARDEDAAAFIERFWARRDPDPDRPGNPVRETAERRALEADRRFSEAGIAGRRTDRGTIWVLHGEPGKIENEPSPLYGEPPLELWRYGAEAEKGLDGKPPARLYRFARRGDVTSFYVPRRPGRYTQREPWRGSGRR
ncbi:MAG: GWxTD domain-containing protein [Thermoanaerobaculia bacterium]|nr:MAG: GWxTD domain-containing protein [Thermoanaerobaculia bacterium]